MAERPKGRSYIMGTPIAWIAAMGALVGVTSFVPLLPYPGGGGYWPLAVVLAIVAPLILGPIPGIISAFVGGVIGMFIAPGAYPLGIFDAFQVATIPAIMAGLALNTGPKKYLALFAAVFVLTTLSFLVVLFVYPCIPCTTGGWAPINPVDYFLVILYYWVLPGVVLLSPIGTKYVFNWARSSDMKQRFVGLFIGLWMAMNIFYLSPTFWTFWIIFEYPAALLYFQAAFVYTWYMPLFSILSTVIAAPIATALGKSGMAKPPNVIW